MNEDAEFEAFLHGEGELSRRLHAMPQVSPSAELDAAILGRIRTSMAQQSTDAANDPGESAVIPMLAPGLGMRWRVPAGLAATVLVGLFATQAYQASDERQRLDMPMEEAIVVAPVEEGRAPAPLATPLAKPAASPAVSKKNAVSARSAPPSVPEAPVAAQVAQPMPVLAAPAPAPAPPPVQATVANVTTARPAARADSQLSGMYASDAAKAAPMPQVVMAPAAEYKSTHSGRDAEGRAPITVMSPQRVEITGSSIRRDLAPLAAPVWVEMIEALLKEGKDDAAKQEWAKFRLQYPAYETPKTLDENMKSLSR